MAISLIIEIEKRYIEDLYQQLEKLLKFHEMKPNLDETEPEMEWIIYLNVTFASGKGELSIEIPNVPG
ncbi:MAG: hypothetical protein AAFO07_24965 [Bacteroidota bacterium]